jgi:hypothetical protein
MMMVVVVSAAAAAKAQTRDEWEFQLAPLYLWAVDLGGEMTMNAQDVPFEVKLSDAVDNLEMAFTVHFEAWKGDWGLLADLNYLDLGSDVTVPPPGSVSFARVELLQTMIELGAGYRFAPSTSVPGEMKLTKLW